MIRLFTQAPIKLIYIGIIAVLLSARQCLAIEFNELTARPEAYVGKCVSVIGVAEVDGISFTLWQPPRRELRHEIFVGQERGKLPHDKLNNHWVKITGVVEVDREGIFACKIFLKNVDRLPRPEVPSTRTYAVFYNDGPETVRLVVSNKAGNERTELTLFPKKTDKILVHEEGTAEVYLSNDLSKKAFSVCVVPSIDSSPGLFDEATRSCHFRISRGKLELVNSRRKGEEGVSPQD